MATDGPMADSEEDAETSDDEPTLPLARRLRLRRRRDDNDDDDMDSHSDHDDDSDTEGDQEGGRGGGGFSVSCRQQWRTYKSDIYNRQNQMLIFCLCTLHAA